MPPHNLDKPAPIVSLKLYFANNMEYSLQQPHGHDLRLRRKHIPPAVG